MHSFPPKISPLVLHDGRLWGWASTGNRQELKVDLLLDGALVASELTGPALPAAVQRVCGQAPDTMAGFCFPLPHQTRDGFEHQLQAMIPDLNDGGLYSPLLTLPAKPLRGDIQQYGRDLVGNIWLEVKPTRLPTLRITGNDGRLLHTQRLTPGKQPDSGDWRASFSVALASLGPGPLNVCCNGITLRGSPLIPHNRIGGVVENLTPTTISGWALDICDLQRPLQLALRVDGIVLDWFHCNVARPDLTSELSLPQDRMALPGFSIPVPNLLHDGKPHLVEVLETNSGQVLDQGQQRVQWQPVGLAYVPSLPSRRKPARAGALRKFPAPQVSVVILNRNGAGLLQDLLTSWQTHNHSIPAELIIIDHASTDHSLAVLKGWQHSLDLQAIPLPRNDSFSTSCNLGASRARAPVLLFLNNDIQLLQDVLPQMLSILAEPGTGIVGLKLLKRVASFYNDAISTHVVQHLGVRFTLNHGYLPFETMPSSSGKEPEFSPALVPAVTGAALMCRKADFDAAGGFDPEYFYGFEDVEFCLRLGERLGKQVICCNNVAALHHHGFTRLSGRERAVFDRLEQNTAVLQRHIGLWIKRRWWSSLVSGDGYFTREPLRIGLVGAATALAPALAVAHPLADLRLLQPGQDWKQVSGLQVLVVGDPRYDVRRLEAARSDLLLVAAVDADPGVWLKQPWWQEFEAVLAPATKAKTLAKRLQVSVHSSLPAQPLGGLLDPGQPRVRVEITGNWQDDSARHRAQLLQQHLRQAGMGCRLVEPGTAARMSDVCVRLHPRRAKRVCSRIENDVLIVEWPPGLPAPGAAWLSEELEKHLGSTFRPS